MPSNTHELTVDLFRVQPGLATGLVTAAAGIDLTGYPTIREATGALADMKPATFTADTVFVLGTRDRDKLAVIVEVQLGRDDDKQWVWLAYLANLRAKIKKPVMLLVVCLDRPTARWAAKAITTGHPGLVFTPIVAGPDRLPVITDPERIAAEPYLATLAALTHSKKRKLQAQVLEPYLRTMIAMGGEQFELYADYVVSDLKRPSDRKHWEDYMSQFVDNYRDTYRAKHEARGEARGRARGEALGRARGEADALRVLAARGIDVPPDAAARITSCDDTDQLTTWIDRSVTANTIEDLFTEAG